MAGYGGELNFRKMKVFANILWFLLGGLLLGLWDLLSGVLYCITIIGIPFGVQLMKLGIFMMAPFGREPVFAEPMMGFWNTVLNIIWICLGGVELAVTHLVLGAVLCLTIIGIPFGRQHFKMVKYALLPFGQFASAGA